MLMTLIIVCRKRYNFVDARQIRSTSRDACVQRPGTVGGGQPTGPPAFSPCVVELYPLQLFVVSEGGYVMADESVCLDSPDSGFDEPQVRFLACAQLERQQWDVDFQVIGSMSEVPLFHVMQFLRFRRRGRWFIARARSAWKRRWMGERR